MATLQSTTVRIGGLPITLNVADHEFYLALQKRYEGFTQTTGGDCQLDIQLGTPGPVDPDADIAVRCDGHRWFISRGDFTAEWDAATRRGIVRQTPNPYSIDTVLRIIHTLILAEEGGFLLHASSVARNGRAFLCSGVSGAGKTTISRLAPADAVLLTDEISYVRRDVAGYRAYGTPFAGELAKSGEDISAPVATAYLLVQGPENRIDPVDGLTAVRALMRNVLFFAADPALVKRIFDSIFDFVTRVPVMRLTFLPVPQVWDLIQ